MANYTIKFYDKKDHQKTLEVFVNSEKTISIVSDDECLNIVDLDISTAIKFAKTLRTEINKAKDFQNEAD